MLGPWWAGTLSISVSSQIACMGRSYTAALPFVKRAITIDSEFWIGHMQLGQAYEQLGEPQFALDALNDAARLSGGNNKPLCAMWLRLREKRTR